MDRPDAFSNHLARWVRNKCTTSIVFVELRPRDASEVKKLWDKCSPIGGPKEDFPRKDAARLELCGHSQCSTGFVVRRVNGALWILTCAHVLGLAFSSKFTITAAKVNELYEPMILCDHQEQRYQTEIESDENAERAYMEAEVTQVARSKDLMLLIVSAGEVQKTCQQPHPPLHMARSFPKTLVEVVMLSWPPDLHRTAVTGTITHPARHFKPLLGRNPRGFKMMLAQVDMTSERGSSGAPLLDGDGNYLATLHSGNKTFSFFVSFDDLRTVLTA